MTDLWIPPNITPNPNLIQTTICHQMQDEILINNHMGGCFGIDCYGCLLHTSHTNEFITWILPDTTQTSQTSQIDLF